MIIIYFVLKLMQNKLNLEVQLFWLLLFLYFFCYKIKNEIIYRYGKRAIRVLEVTKPFIPKYLISP